MDLFSAGMNKHAPLADRMRPRTLDEFVGQQHIVGKGKLLRRAIETDSLQSSIFFGPPGCGKTTLASIVANTTGSEFVKLNAVTSGVKDVREVIAAAEDNLKLYGRETYLLLDECHRWSKAQSEHIAGSGARDNKIHRLHHGKPHGLHDGGYRFPLPRLSVLPADRGGRKEVRQGRRGR
ncbi:MAG: AAA family ATPase [Christensenellales bacterium]